MARVRRGTVPRGERPARRHARPPGDVQPRATRSRPHCGRPPGGWDVWASHDDAPLPGTCPTSEPHRSRARRRCLVRALLIFARRPRGPRDLRASSPTARRSTPTTGRTRAARCSTTRRSASSSRRFLVEEVYANVDVAGESRARLPPRLQPLAGPAASALRNVAERATSSALDRPARAEGVGGGQPAHRAAVHQHRRGQLDGGHDLGRRGRPRPARLVLDIVQRLGLPAAIAEQDPARDAGKIKIMSRQPGPTVQTRHGAAQPRGGPAGARARAAGARRLPRPRPAAPTLMERRARCSSCAGLLVLSPARSPATRSSTASRRRTASEPAAAARVGHRHRILRDVAQATIILGIPLVLAALLAGPAASAATPAARWPRRCASARAWRTARSRVLVLIVAWGPSRRPGR